MLLQTVAAVCQFPDVQSAVAGTLMTIQCNIPVARIGVTMSNDVTFTFNTLFQVEHCSLVQSVRVHCKASRSIHVQ